MKRKRRKTGPRVGLLRQPTLIEQDLFDGQRINRGRRYQNYLDAIGYHLDPERWDLRLPKHHHNN